MIFVFTWAQPFAYFLGFAANDGCELSRGATRWGRAGDFDGHQAVLSVTDYRSCFSLAHSWSTFAQSDLAKSASTYLLTAFLSSFMRRLFGHMTAGKI